MQLVRCDDRLQSSLTEITRLLERHRVLDAFAQRQATSRRDLIENLQHRQKH